MINTILILGIIIFVLWLIFFILKLLVLEARRTQTRKSKEEIGQEGELMVADILAEINGFHRVINNIIIEHENTSTQIDHILINTNGIFCIETKNWAGRISGKENYDLWYQWYDKTPYNSEPDNKLENPLKQNKHHIAVLQKILKKNQIKYEINSVIVMANNNADYIEANNVINVVNLKDYIENYYQSICLTNQEINKIYIAIISERSSISLEEHIANINH